MENFENGNGKNGWMRKGIAGTGILAALGGGWTVMDSRIDAKIAQHTVARLEEDKATTTRVAGLEQKLAEIAAKQAERTDRISRLEAWRDSVLERVRR